MNYIQIEIGPLKQDDKGKDIPNSNLRGWKVNQMTIEIWSNMLNYSAFNSSSNYAAVYGGLVANCEAKRVEPDFTYEQVCDWVDELNLTDKGPAVMQQVKEVFEASQYFIKILEGLNATLTTVKKDGTKKKIVKKK